MSSLERELGIYLSLLKSHWLTLKVLISWIPACHELGLTDFYNSTKITSHKDADNGNRLCSSRYEQATDNVSYIQKQKKIKWIANTYV